MEVDIFLNTNEIKKLEEYMFSDSRLPKEELWLLGFAAPALVNDKYFSNEWIIMDEKKRHDQRYSIASNQGIDKEADFLECIDEFISFGVSLYLDEMLIILKNKSPDEWGRSAKKILPINEKQVAKIKNLKSTIDKMDKFGLPFPQKTLRAFDFARAAKFCVLSYALNGITKEKTYIKMQAIASEALIYYSSWEEYVCAYTLAYELHQWGMEDFFALGCSGFQSEARVLLLSPKSPYQSINFFWLFQKFGKL